MSPERAYVSVLSFPPDMTERERTIALAEAMGTDEYSAQITQKWVPPAVIKACPIGQAEEIVRTLEELGISAYAAKQGHLDKLSNPILAKRLLPAIGAPTPMYAYETLRPRLHAPGAFVMKDVFAMISGRVRERYSVAATHLPTPEHGYPLDSTGAEHSAGRSAGGGTGSVITSRVQDRYLLDVYLKDSRCVRIDTGQFSFDFLEGKLGFTDRENYQRLTDRFRSEAPMAIFDEGFAEFRPPPNILTRSSRTFGGGLVTSQDAGPAFDFYSAWKCLLLAHLRKRNRAEQ